MKPIPPNPRGKTRAALLGHKSSDHAWRRKVTARAREQMRAANDPEVQNIFEQILKRLVGH